MGPRPLLHINDAMLTGRKLHHYQGRDQYATFSGRARRSEYWWFYLATLIVFSVLQMIVLPRDYVARIQDGTLEYGAGFFIYGLVALALFIPSLAVLVRRLHDTGKSGWFYWIILIPIAGIIILLVRLAKESDNGSNAYGPDPRV